MTRLLDVDGGTVRRFLAGDLLAIAVFVGLGELSHGIDPLARPVYALETLVPFLVGWLVAAPLARAYAADAGRGAVPAVVLGVAGWVLADAVGQVVRETEALHGGADPAFFAVAAVVGGGLIAVWRLLATVLAARSG